jgi:hypothetical protein
MAVEADFVRRIFAGLEHSDGAAFFSHVADDVDCTVMGTHPLAGHYMSKAEFMAATFAKLGKVLPAGAQLHVDDLLRRRRCRDCRITFQGNRQKWLSLRQPLLLGVLFQEQQDHSRPRLSRLGDGGAPVRGESCLATSPGSHLAPLAGRGRRALARRVRGTLRESSARIEPLTPTLSPQAGRGEGRAEREEREFISLQTAACACR